MNFEELLIWSYDLIVFLLNCYAYLDLMCVA